MKLTVGCPDLPISVANKVGNRHKSRHLEKKLGVHIPPIPIFFIFVELPVGYPFSV